MKNLFSKFFNKPEKLIFLIFVSTLILFLVSLGVSDFNLLKILVFLGFLLTAINLGFFLYLQKLPEKEKIQFFYLVQNLLDYLNEAIVIYDNEFKIKFVNQAFARLVNLKKEDLIGFQVSQVMIKNEKYEMLANIFFPFLRSQNLKIINKEPETIEVSFIEPKEKYFLISHLDIFLGKPYKLRIILDKTEDVIESRKKLEFIQLIAHNFLTPLNEIRWILEAIDFNKISEENKEYLKSALGIIKSTVIFSEAILTFLRTETARLELKIEEVKLEDIFKNILDILKDKIREKKIKVNIEISEKVETLPADKSLITAGLFAILENAILYNKTGGSVEITISKQPQRPYLEIKIKDTGIGMTKEDLENLFKKYYRGQKAKDLEIKGFGIGFYTAKSIINLHGGEIKVESEENQGTTVSLLLPLDPNLIPKA